MPENRCGMTRHPLARYASDGASNALYLVPNSKLCNSLTIFSFKIYLIIFQMSCYTQRKFIKINKLVGVNALEITNTGFTNVYKSRQGISKETWDKQG